MTMMKNKDEKAMASAEARERMKAALESGDSDQAIVEMTKWAEQVQSDTIAMAKESMGADMRDATVLAQRGCRQLTTKEDKFYRATIEAMRSDMPMKALNNLDVVLPKTVIDQIFTDLVYAHPLLDAITINNTMDLVEIYRNTNSKQLAIWGELTDTITKELTSGFEKINLAQHKLSAFLPVSNAMLDLGQVWLDSYVRQVLAEALAWGLEDAIVNGDGSKGPIGMTRKISGATDNVYPLKTATKITDLYPETLGAIIAAMAIDRKGMTRTVGRLIMVVNTIDYYTKIGPATTMLVNGTYVNDILPFPITIIQSTEIAQGQAVLGMADKYFAYLGTARTGKLEYSNEYRFLEDQRVYRIKLYGGGQADDENAFQLLDVSGITPLYDRVKIVGTVATKEQA